MSVINLPHDKIMTTMKGMDMRRLWLTMRLNAVNNRAEAMRMFFIMMFGLLLIYEVKMFDMRLTKYGDMAMMHAVDELSMITCGIFVTYMLFMPGMMFASMRTKRQRTVALMLPASAAEKFVTRWLWVTAGMAMIYVAAVICADLLRALLGLVAGDGAGGSVALRAAEGFPGNIIYLFGASYNEWYATTYYISLAVLCHSLFLLGGTLFRKNALICTLAVLLALRFIVFPIVNPLNLCRDGLIAVCGDMAGNLAAAAVALCLTALSYCLSYRLFRRMEAVNNRLINI